MHVPAQAVEDLGVKFDQTLLFMIIYSILFQQECISCLAQINRVKHVFVRNIL